LLTFLGEHVLGHSGTLGALVVGIPFLNEIKIPNKYLYLNIIPDKQRDICVGIFYRLKQRQIGFGKSSSGDSFHHF